MDMRKVSAYFDYFIVLSANNSRQIKAISDEIEERLRDEGVRLWHREGGRDAKWVLLDFGDCLVHLFEPDARRLYDLEGLWGDAPQEKLG
jgi:ribosome-associated protein